MTSNYSFRQFSYWTALGIVSVITLFVWLLLGSSLLGYRLATVHGTSMQPALHDGDTLLMKYQKPDEIRIGQIVRLHDPFTNYWIAHRVIRMEMLSEQSYLIVTKGDANQLSENWVVDKNEEIAVSYLSISNLKGVLDFLESRSGVTLIGLVTILLMIILWFRHSRYSQKT